MEIIHQLELNDLAYNFRYKIRIPNTEDGFTLYRLPIEAGLGMVTNIIKTKEPNVAIELINDALYDDQNNPSSLQLISIFKMAIKTKNTVVIEFFILHKFDAIKNMMLKAIINTDIKRLLL